jgi:hypothetical protein
MDTASKYRTYFSSIPQNRGWQLLLQPPTFILLKDMTQAGTTAPLAAALQNFQNIFKIK